MKLTPLKVARFIVVNGSAIGAAGTAAECLNTLTPPVRNNPLSRGLVWMGKVSLSGMAGAAASDYVGKQFDEIVALIKGS